MSKYELKQWYPSLPKWMEKGEEVKYNKEERAYTNCDLRKGCGIPPKEVENNPKHWRKVKEGEKEYKILAFKYENGNIWSRIDDSNLFWWNRRENTINLDELLNSNDYEIFSVKRLSDGKIFTIGDRIIHKDARYNVKITSIEFGIVHKDKLFLYEKSMNIALQNALPVKKVFTTENGVDIHEGEEYYFIGSARNILKSKVDTKEDWEEKNGDSDYKRFSTKEAAEEYLEDDEPLYSKAELREVIDDQSSTWSHDGWRIEVNKLKRDLGL